MFGEVDLNKPHCVITVKEPVKLMWLRRTPLAPGVYRIQGDVRGRIGRTADRRAIDVGKYTVEYISDRIVSTWTQSPEPVLPAPGVVTTPKPIVPEYTAPATMEEAKPVEVVADAPPKIGVNTESSEVKADQVAVDEVAEVIQPTKPTRGRKA